MKIDYLLTGSFAPSLQGEPRATHDIDLVVELRPDSCRARIECFGRSELYVNEEAAAKSCGQENRFVQSHQLGGDKVDFWILTLDDFDQVRFRRRRTVEVFGLGLEVSSPEDTILMKLRWARDSSGSKKHSVDALRVYEMNLDALDTGYLEQWVSRLGIREEWAELLDQADPL